MPGVLVAQNPIIEDMTQFPNFALAGAAFLTLFFFPNQAGAALVHTYNAATPSNTATTWQDTTGTRNWTLGSTILSSSLEVPSAVAWITALADLNASFQSVVVPEPGSGLLAVLGMAVLPRRRRRSVLTD